MENSIVISSSMEDYLKTILNITKKKGSARITEIAESLNIAASSVTEVISKLINLRMVTQEKYGPVILTAKGRDYAEKIAFRHKVIKNFLIDVLGVNTQVAEKDACLMEHVVSSVTINHLIAYLNNISNGSYQNSLSTQEKEEEMKTSRITSLRQLAVGTQGRVVRIAASGNLKRRFLDMGLVQGALVKVKGKAPLGDPIKIDIEGDNLSLRKNEASEIYVEVE